MIESERKKPEPGKTSLDKTQNITFKHFLKILEENFRRPEGVEFLEEKNLLLPANKTVSEIGFELGYYEKDCFIAVFKKKSDQTPTGFHEEMSKLIS